MFRLVSSLLVLGVALGPQVVLGSFKFQLSPVTQCQPVQISFSGSGANNHSVPTFLTVLPLVDNGLPIQIPIPNGATNTTGIQLSFIPLAAGSLFVASLDNGVVSDVTKVGPSTGANDTTCLTTTALDGPLLSDPFYQIPTDEEVNQCENFTVTYNTTQPPVITAFIPRAFSFELPLNDNVSQNEAQYVMNGVRGVQVVLLFNDTASNMQTSRLITIGGDSSSSKSCFNTTSSSDSNGKTTTKSSKKSGLPKAAVIGIAVGAAVLIFVAMVLLWFLLRQRRRRSRGASVPFDPALLNRRWPPNENRGDMYDHRTNSQWSADEKKPDLFEQQTPSTIPSFGSNNYVLDPAYTNDAYRASAMTDDESVRTSISSWNQFVPADQRNDDVPPTPTAPRLGPGPAPTARRTSVTSSHLSMNTVDIQNILQMATVYRDSTATGGPVTGRTPQPSTAGTAMTTFDVARPAVARLVSTRRAQRGGGMPDIPASVSRNNSAVAAAVGGVPAPYSYIAFGGGAEEDEPAVGTTPRAVGGLGDAEYDYPMPALNRSNSQRDTSESWGNKIVR